MKLTNTRRELRKYGKAVITNARANLKKQGMGKSELSGNLRFSVAQKIKSGNVLDMLTFSFGASAKYWDFVDQGVRGSGGYKKKKSKQGGARGATGIGRGKKSPYKFKSKNIAKGVIAKWIVTNGIRLRGADGKFISKTAANIKSSAFAIGRAIAMRGLTPTHFISGAFEKQQKKYINYIVKAFSKDVEINLKTELKKD